MPRQPESLRDSGRSFCEELKLQPSEAPDSNSLEMPACHHCGSVQSNLSQKNCEVCESAIHSGEIDDRSVWAYLFGAAALYIPANILPVMTMSLLGDTNNYTITGGILYLWDEGDYLPAVIVFCGSIIVLRLRSSPRYSPC